MARLSQDEARNFIHISHVESSAPAQKNKNKQMWRAPPRSSSGHAHLKARPSLWYSLSISDQGRKGQGEQIWAEMACATTLLALPFCSAVRLPEIEAEKQLWIDCVFAGRLGLPGCQHKRGPRAWPLPPPCPGEQDRWVSSGMSSFGALGLHSFPSC